MGNQLYYVRGIGYGSGGHAAAIIANGVSSGSTNNCFKSIGDYVEDADVGLVFSGNGGGHEVHDLTLKNVTTAPVLIQDEGSGAVPSNCVIDGIHMLGCSYVGSPAMVNIGGGTNHTIKGLKFSGCTYAVQLWLNAGANYNYVYPIDGPNGTTANIFDSGTGNQLYSFSGGGGSYLPLSGGALSGALSGTSAAFSGPVSCGTGGLITLVARQTSPGFFTGGDGADSLGTRFNALVIALGNLGLIG